MLALQSGSKERLVTPDFDFALGDDADMIRDTTARFAADRIAPLATRIDAEDWFPRDELWTAMGALGLHGITVEEQWGGLGLGSGAAFGLSGRLFRRVLRFCLQNDGFLRGRFGGVSRLLSSLYWYSFDWHASLFDICPTFWLTSREGQSSARSSR